ncbi:thyroglobulin type 1 repeat containing [Trichuris trichiura]|uniref:Thyroglobulin type 1 repeat containing n=1 Tax=Trichuris trichiura TaxID=36087 RepID=A0A077Z7Q5_TRITR|nr:thyroglobulin type 1 repeat containing [Trichuris trichiura]
MMVPLLQAMSQSCDTRVLCPSSSMVVDPVCGSDGRTYNSLCEVKRVVCYGNPVKVKYRGPCLEKGRCQLERSFQLELAAKRNLSTLFVPECEEDGSFSSIQVGLCSHIPELFYPSFKCHKSTGYCWCVTTSGKPVPGTSNRFKKPSCLPQGKVGRRSSTTQMGRSNGACTSAYRSTFISNLIKMFQGEHEREMHHKHRYHDLTVIPSPARTVIEWKFNRLDVNHDNKISSGELRRLRELIKALVQPTACAKRFPKFCDLDHDRKISRSEWTICMGVDVNMAFRLFLTLNKVRQEAMIMTDDQKSYNAPVLDGMSRLPLYLMEKKKTRRDAASRQFLDLHAASMLAASSNSGSFGLKENRAAHREAKEEERNDCRSQRQRALEDHRRNPSSGIYMPACSPTNDRLYQQVQCHKLTGFCWCSDPETGKPIPNTSTKNAKPVCDKSWEKVKLSIRGCGPKKLRRFLFQLFSTLESSMIASGYNELAEEMSRRDLAVRWKFQDMDKNKNKKLERKEWKYYRAVLKQWKGVRKCGRNFLRACDSNGDSVITEKEWLNCTIELYECKPLNEGPFCCDVLVFSAEDGRKRQRT